MTFHKEENIIYHIKTLSKDDWERLFVLIPIIESTDNFIEGGGIEEDEYDPNSFKITPVQSAKVVRDFEKVVYDLKLVIDFDWGSWDEGREIASTGDYENLDTVTLLKLLTAFIRNNRFRDGALASRFEDKSIENILKELKEEMLISNFKE